MRSFPSIHLTIWTFQGVLSVILKRSITLNDIGFVEKLAASTDHFFLPYKSCEGKKDVFWQPLANQMALILGLLQAGSRT